MMETSLHCLLFLTTLSCHAADEARLAVSPRSPWLEGDSVVLSCEEDHGSAGWTVKRNTTERQSECGRGWENLLVPPVTSAASTNMILECTGVSPEREQPAAASSSLSLVRSDCGVSVDEAVWKWMKCCSLSLC
ncbi:hypothetical protein GOODEAATRI_025583 [Goodea atripinnis]|uniref:Uncharacterized protein n=1 Tax=Goodea atripinnis TaxID=208336 RepID=A0ABV0MV53_9TELE